MWYNRTGSLLFSIIIFRSGALSDKLLLVRIVESNKMFAYFEAG